MTQQFLEKIHPYILSDDPHVQDFVLRIIHDGHLGNDDTFLLILEANDQNKPNALYNKFIPRTNNIPIGEKGFKALLERIKRQDDNQEWYRLRLLRCNATLIHQYRSELEKIYPPEFVNVYGQIPTFSEEELSNKLEVISYGLEQEFESYMYQHGKRIIEHMVHRNILSNSDITNKVRHSMEEDELDYEGLLYTYAAGIANCTELIPDLAPLIRNDNDDDFAVEVIANTLTKMGTDEVAEHVKPLIPNSFFAISILESIKTRHAEEILLASFDQVNGIMEKTAICESLCFQLSTEAFPKIEQLIETGYDKQMTSLEEALYPNLVINNIDHHKKDEWKAFLDEQNDPEKEEQMHRDILAKFEEFKQQKEEVTQPVKSEKVGRNEPCPCGSGKKYKKCCGK